MPLPGNESSPLLTLPKTRFLLILFAAVALTASLSSLYVHYNLLTDSSYTSFCDVSATVNCEDVYQSAYGTVASTARTGFGTLANHLEPMHVIGPLAWRPSSAVRMLL